MSNANSIEEQFLGYSSPYSPPSLQPIPYFSSLHLTLPTSIRSNPVENGQNSRDQNYFPTELSPIYLNASAAHICAADINYQVKACSLLDKTAISVLTLLSDPAYMIPSQWELVMNLMNGLTLFITTRSQLFSLFKNRTNDINEMVKILHAHGCGYLVLNNAADGYEINDFQKKKIITVPNYPSSIIDPTGIHEVFCGGLLAEMRRSHDPVQAVDLRKCNGIPQSRRMRSILSTGSSPRLARGPDSTDQRLGQSVVTQQLILVIIQIFQKTFPFSFYGYTTIPGWHTAEFSSQPAFLFLIWLHGSNKQIIDIAHSIG